MTYTLPPQIEIDSVYNIDCVDGMRLMKEQGLVADWCIADPPYGIGVGSQTYAKGIAIAGNGLAKRRDYSGTNWDSQRLDKSVIDLMREMSKQQIIFGGNYYTDILPPTKSWLVWDKRQPDEHNSFADCELAWCSADVARVIHYYYNGMLQGDMRNKDYRFHATQKPTQLYAKVLTLYTKEGDLILDPCAGSQALRIACHRLKRHYIGFEINKEYYDKGCDWYAQATAQMSIFDLM